jgi:hypothetical protein
MLFKTYKILVILGLIFNTFGVLGIGFVVEYVQICGPYRGGLGKPKNKCHEILNRIFWIMIVVGFLLQILGILNS